MTVEGVSLVTTYRSTFAEEIRQSGIDGLIKSLQEKNSSAASRDEEASSSVATPASIEFSDGRLRVRGPVTLATVRATAGGGRAALRRHRGARRSVRE